MGNCLTCGNYAEHCCCQESNEQKNHGHSRIKIKKLEFECVEDHNGFIPDKELLEVDRFIEKWSTWFIMEKDSSALKEAMRQEINHLMRGKI